MKRERLIKKLETDGPEIIRVRLSYNIGGMNYFSSKVEERGLWLHVEPIVESKGSVDGVSYTTTEYRGWSGVKDCVKPMKRFNQKVLDEFELDEVLVNTMVNHVLRENKLVLDSKEVVHG